MPAEVEDHDAAMQVEAVGDAPDMRPAPVEGEAVCDHEAKAPVAGEVDGLDWHAIVGHQNLGFRHRLRHEPILRDDEPGHTTRSSLTAYGCGRLVPARSARPPPWR